MPKYPIPESLPEKLGKRYPGIPTEEILQGMLDKHGSYRGVAKALGVGLATAFRWCQHYKLDKPNRVPLGMQMAPITRYLAQCPGRNTKDRMRKLKEKHGTWRAVAIEIGVSFDEMKRFRRNMGLVDMKEDNPKRIIDSRGDEWRQFHEW